MPKPATPAATGSRVAIATYVTPDIASSLGELARYDGISVSAVLRRLVLRELRATKQQPVR